ncbi:hydrolase [Sphingobium sp. IP1]|nr:hydrolase [Sphingobium sp. IP1]
MIRTSLFVGTALVLAGLSQTVRAAEQADMLLTNAVVVTMDPDRPSATSVAVKDGKILAVGGDELTIAYTAPETIDLKGRVLMPGFIDTHIHITGQSRRSVALETARSIKDVQARVKAKAKELGPGEWIIGYGWDEAKLSEGRNIVSTDLDVAAPRNPVALTRAGQHSVVGNSVAMKIAGIVKGMPDPDRGVVERYSNGEPNGIIRERGDLYSKHIPQPSSQEMKPSWTAALRSLLPLGITSIMEALSTIDDEPIGKGGAPASQWRGVHTYKQFREIYAEDGESLPRAALYIVYPGAERLKAFPYKTGYGDDRLKLGPIGEAPAADGGFTGPTAWTIDDYKGMPGFRGHAALKPDEMDELVRTSRDLGWQLGIHAIGDAAIARLIESYASALDEAPIKDHRWFSSHLTMLPPLPTLQTMASHGIWGAAQPNFLYNLEGRYNQTLEGGRLQHINPLGTPLRFGVHMTLGSDNLPIGPLWGFYVAVTRKGESGTVYGEEEAVSRYEALKAYTQDAAYLTWDEAKKGSLTPGKLADMIVMDRNLLTIPEEEILKAQVEMTFIGGKMVFKR